MLGDTVQENHKAPEPCPAVGTVPGRACGRTGLWYGEVGPAPTSQRDHRKGGWVSGTEEGGHCRQSTCVSRCLGVGQVWAREMAGPAGSERAPERGIVGREDGEGLSSPASPVGPHCCLPRVIREHSVGPWGSLAGRGFCLMGGVATMRTPLQPGSCPWPRNQASACNRKKAANRERTAGQPLGAFLVWPESLPEAE